MSKPETFVMLTREFGFPIYIGELSNFDITVTDKPEEATRWTVEDTQSTVKLKAHAAFTGFKKLQFEKI